MALGISRTRSGSFPPVVQYDDIGIAIGADDLDFLQNSLDSLRESIDREIDRQCVETGRGQAHFDTAGGYHTRVGELAKLETSCAIRHDDLGQPDHAGGDSSCWEPSDRRGPH